MNILSKAVIDQLIRDTSLELLPIMVNSFIDELDRRTITFEEIAIEWRAEASCIPLRDAAHALKSCSGTFGAELLFEHAKNLEDALRNEQHELVPEYIHEVRTAIQKTHQVYSAYRDELNQ